MDKRFSLEGRKVLITGASSGIGRQCAVDCSAMGATVVTLGRDEHRLKETLEMMEGTGHRTFAFDLTDNDTLTRVISTVTADIGPFDGFIHSAGIEKTLPVKLLTLDDYEQLFRVNALSAFGIVKSLSGKKTFAGGGSMVLISSISGMIARGGVAAYAASKGALASASRVFAKEFASRAVRVNCVSPGTVLTPMMEKYLSTLDEEEYARRVSNFPLGLGRMRDVSSACVFLLSDASRWITGQNIVVDGGYTML